MKIRKSSLLAFLFLLFPLFSTIGGFLSYYDEAFGTVAFAWVWILMVKGRLSQTNQRFVILLTVITGIGLISNYFSAVLKDLFPILVDVLWLWKPFACYIFFSTICADSNIRGRILSALQTPAKFGIILLLVTAILGQFVNIGVTGDTRILGLKTFGFFWGNSIQTGWLAFSCVLILAMTPISEKNFRTYLTAAIIPLLLTDSSLVYCWIFVVVALMFMIRENTVFKKSYIVALALGICLFTMADIQAYFSAGASSVRKTMIEGGIYIANTYFPLGSGFATYGSEMASQYYSQLYIWFGWENTWAFGRNSKFLNDNFYAGIVGQFGWFGFALYLVMLYLLFKVVNTRLVSKRIRVTAIATVITIAVVMIGSASAKSMMGVCTFSVLGIVGGMIESARRQSAQLPADKQDGQE